jgi:hypothetical protein
VKKIETIYSHTGNQISATGSWNGRKVITSAFAAIAPYINASNLSKLGNEDKNITENLYVCIFTRHMGD